MIATKAEHKRSGVQHPVSMRLDAVEHTLWVVRINETVAIIHRRKRFERIEAEREMFQFGKLHRAGADGARPQAATRTVGHGIVIGYAADNKVNPGKVAAVAAARETQRPPYVISTQLPRPSVSRKA